MLRAKVAVLAALAMGACAPAGAARTGSPAPVARAPVVSAGDSVQLRIFREEEMSGTFAVSQGGTVTLPRLGEVRAAGHTVPVLQDSLRRAYGAFLRTPSIEVTVQRRVAVLGAVRRPDVYMIDLTMTLRDVIAAAGGLEDRGDPRRVYVVRNGRRIAAGGPASAFTAAQLESGDQVLVPPRRENLIRSASSMAAGVGSLLGLFLLVRDQLSKK